MQGTLVIASVVSAILWCAVHGKPSTIEYGLRNHAVQRNLTHYKFTYEVPGHSRRSEFGEASSEEISGEERGDFEVKGEYSFISPNGEQHEFKYQADDEGYRVESDSGSLPQRPEDTDEVKAAREAFFDAYCKVLGKPREDCEIDKFFKGVETVGRVETVDVEVEATTVREDFE